MKLLSKAEEISKALDLMNRGVITKSEYKMRLSNILSAPYKPHDNGIESNDENEAMKRLVENGTIKEKEYQVQWKQIETTVAFGYQKPADVIPQILPRKGYVAPIVWLVIGGIGVAAFVGIPIVIIALIVLVSRVNYNKRIDAQNAQMTMEYMKR
jgi:hypothetical protein